MSISLGERVRNFFKRDYSYSFPPGFTSLLEEIEEDFRIAERVKDWNTQLREKKVLCSEQQREMCLACSNYLLGIDQPEKEHKMFTCQTTCKSCSESIIDPELSSTSKPKYEEESQ